MATTTKAAAPAKKSGFQGVKAAWIILVICACAGYGVWYFVMGNPDNFVGGDRSGHPANLLGTVYKGGFVVGLILTLLFTVICLGIERFFASSLLRLRMPSRLRTSQRQRISATRCRVL